MFPGRIENFKILIQAECSHNAPHVRYNKCRHKRHGGSVLIEIAMIRPSGVKCRRNFRANLLFSKAA